MAAPKTATKTTRDIAKAVEAKPHARTRRPPVKDMITTCLAELNDTRQGSSLAALKKLMAQKFRVDVKTYTVHIKKAIKVLVESSVIINMAADGNGLKGRWKLAVKKPTAKPKATTALKTKTAGKAKVSTPKAANKKKAADKKTKAADKKTKTVSKFARKEKKAVATPKKGKPTPKSIKSPSLKKAVSKSPAPKKGPKKMAAEKKSSATVKQVLSGLIVSSPDKKVALKAAPAPKKAAKPAKKPVAKMNASVSAPEEQEVEEPEVPAKKPRKAAV